VTVLGTVTLTNLPATAITGSSATLNATLVGNGTTHTVLAYWNTLNAGTSAALWTNSTSVGVWTNQGLTNLTCVVTGLLANRQYYFTFRATNALQNVWATNVLTYTTLGPPTASFTAAPTNGYAPLRVVFTDTSTGSITNREWNFGDGNTFSATAQTVVTNLYVDPGINTVTLLTLGSGGAATHWHTGLIHVAAVPVPAFAGPNGLSVDAEGVVSLTFIALAGLRYRLLLKNDLHTTNAWAPVTPPLPDGWTNGANAPITLQDTTGTAVAQRFYRIETKSLSAP